MTPAFGLTRVQFPVPRASHKRLYYNKGSTSIPYRIRGGPGRTSGLSDLERKDEEGDDRKSMGSHITYNQYSITRRRGHEEGFFRREGVKG